MAMDAVFDLTAESVSKRYGTLQALRDVELAVPAGSITALVGPNGAGKTTLLRSWMGFEKPTSGAVKVLGIDPWSQRQVISEVAFLAQTPSLYRELNVRDHLGLIKGLRNTFDDALASRRLDDLGIDPHAIAGNLSGGQAAQVGLALAIGMRARIVLLDEPLASLDPLARRDFLAILVAHATAIGATVVLSSHIVSDIEQSCDRLIAIGNGAVALEGSIAAIRATHWLIGEDGKRTIRPRGVAEAPAAVVRAVEMPAGALRPATLDEIIIAQLQQLKGLA